MTTSENAVSEQTFDRTSNTIMAEQKMEDTRSGRIMSHCARAAAQAFDEVFILKHELALAQQPERDRIAPQIQFLNEQVLNLTIQLETARADLSEKAIQKKLLVEKNRGDVLHEKLVFERNEAKALYEKYITEKNRGDAIQKKYILEKNRGDELQRYNAEILASKSWRITLPLRRVSLALRRFRF